MSKRPLGPPPDWINPEPNDEAPPRDPLRSIFSEARAVRTQETPPSEQPPAQPLAAVQRLAEEKAREVRDQSVSDEIKRRLREEQHVRSEFAAVYAAPSFTSDVPDGREARLVILGPAYTHGVAAEQSPACKAAANYLERRGAGPRRYRNSIVFLAADREGLTRLEAAARTALAWRALVDPAPTVDPGQVAAARTARDEAEAAVDRRLPEAYCWLLVPYQAEPEQPVEWHEFRVEGPGTLAGRAAIRLITEGLLCTELTGSDLKRELDKITQWAGGQVSISQLTEYFAQHLYLPRLRDSKVLQEGIRDGLANRPAEPMSPGPRTYARGPRRFHGTVSLDAVQFARDAARLRTDVLQHLSAVPGARVRVTAEIEVDFREGASEALVRVVSDHCKNLRFTEAEFEGD